MPFLVCKLANDKNWKIVLNGYSSKIVINFIKKLNLKKFCVFQNIILKISSFYVLKNIFINFLKHVYSCFYWLLENCGLKVQGDIKLTLQVSPTFE